MSCVPPAVVQLSDWYTARRRDAEVAQWLSRSLPAGRTAAPVITPGQDGYLLEIPRIGFASLLFGAGLWLVLRRRTIG